MFTLDLLPARHGDALWLRYGDDSSSPHHVLIDGGPRNAATTRAITQLLADNAGLELVVVTHIDADHISGVLAVMEDDTVALAPGDVWFNGWRHLPADILGGRQGERLTAALKRRKLPWNKAFHGAAVCVPDDEDAPLPVVTLPGGLRLTVLSPTRARLAALRPVWKAEVRKAGMVPGEGGVVEPAAAPDLLGAKKIDPDELAEARFTSDDSEANGASIAFLAEFEGKSVLLTGDAHAGVLAAGLRRLARQRGEATIRVDAFKLPHHGSRYNLSPEVLDLVDCGRYLFSTDGTSRSRHPDPIAVSRIIARRENVRLEFNYHTATTAPWDSATMRQEFRYEAIYPVAGGQSLTVEL